MIKAGFRTGQEWGNRFAGEVREHVTEPFKNYDGPWQQRFQDGFAPIGHNIKELGEKAWEQLQEWGSKAGQYIENVFDRD